MCSGGTCGPASTGPQGNVCCDSSGTYCVACAPDTGTACFSQSSCPSGSVCGRDATCHVGDCGGGVGCVGGAACKVEDGIAQCVSVDASASTEAGVTRDASPSDSSTDAAATLDSTMVTDGATEAASPSTVACNADTQCTAVGAGAKCINGQCAPQAQLCSDASQCAVTGESCVDGVCTPTCSASAPCAAGFGCDFTRGVCSENPHVCATNLDCQGGTVCVESHCAAPCAVSDATPGCPAGQICVNTGCIPDQHATFACLNNGQQGPLANKCDPADICLHGDCYLACDTSDDGGGCAAGMTCKEVTIAKGTFAVCGTESTLGSACDSAAGLYCSGSAVCINGYCL